MRLLPITSSMIAAIGWKPYLSPDDYGFLAVQFQNGKCYLYDSVPMAKFVAVITDPESQGKAFNEITKKGEGTFNYYYHETDLEKIEAM